MLLKNKICVIHIKFTDTTCLITQFNIYSPKIVVCVHTRKKWRILIFKDTSTVRRAKSFIAYFRRFLLLPSAPSKRYREPHGYDARILNLLRYLLERPTQEQRQFRCEFIRIIPANVAITSLNNSIFSHTILITCH